MRVFGLMLAGFVALVAVFAMLYLSENRRVSSYAAAVVRGAREQPPGAPTPCTDLTREKPPASIQSCTLSLADGQALVTVQLVNGRELTLRSRLAAP